MNSKAAAILTNPSPCGHIVYPYTDDSQVADAVCLFASAGLRNGEAVLLIMTEQHRGPVLSRLQDLGLDTESLKKSGHLVCEDAVKLLSSFMFDGIIDEYLFKETVGNMIVKAKAASGTYRPVRLFGEMVSLIRNSKPRATERLEELWNEVIQQHGVPLLCAYALSGNHTDAIPESLLALHSHALDSETHAGLRQHVN